MVFQKNLSAILSILVAVGCGPAFAQTPTPGGRAVQNPASSSVAVAPAATGRRQPRAADMPAPAVTPTNQPVDRESPEDEALNRKINGICRGC